MLTSSIVAETSTSQKYSSIKFSPSMLQRGKKHTVPISQMSPQNTQHRSSTFISPDDIALQLKCEDKGPPYYVVTHGLEPRIYTDW